MRSPDNSWIRDRVGCARQLIVEPPNQVDAYYHVVGSILFMLTATVIVALTEALKDAYSQIAAAEERLRTINGGLMHRIRNLFQIYPVHARTRKSFGEMTRKLSVTVSQ